MTGPVLLVGSGDLNQRVARQLASAANSLRMFSRHPAQIEAVETAVCSITHGAQVRLAAHAAARVVIAVESDDDDASPNGPDAVHHQRSANTPSLSATGG